LREICLGPAALAAVIKTSEKPVPDDFAGRDVLLCVHEARDGHEVGSTGVFELGPVG
jgi:hypothetical protein